VTTAPPRPAGAARHMLSTWPRRDRVRAGALLGVVVAMHVVAFGVLLGVVGPGRYHLGTGVFGVGLGVTAYTYGLRHAFDADHIAAIDNTTRKLMADGQRPVSVGFWFAMGHSTTVAALAALVAGGAGLVGTLTGGTGASRTLGLIGTTASGGFLYLIAALNLGALLGILRLFRSLRRGEYDETRLEAHLQSRGALARILGRATRAITRPAQMYPVGLLFGLGFDTASEVALLVLAGSGAAAGVPWYAIAVLPLLFASGMSLLDFLDGLFMTVAYDWALADPVRKIYYSLSVTGLSVAVAFVVGSVELVGVLHEHAGWSDPVSAWISGLDLANVGYVVVGLFVATWLLAVAYWRLARVGDRYRVPEAAP